jgi:hypothetical protein
VESPLAGSFPLDRVDRVNHRPAAVVFGIWAIAQAQAKNVSIQGVVVDQSGQPAPNSL